MTKTWKLAAITMAIFGSVQLSACGGSECGDGTEEKDGTCVIKTPTSCGDGTKLVDGLCVLETDPVTCADGTTLTDGKCEPNATCGDGTTADATGKCVPDFEKIECATGTKQDGANCVPDEAACETGTSLKDGKCVADVVCGAGTTAREGECLTDNDILKLDADVTEAAGQNDPNFGGMPQVLTLPAASSSLTVAGKINSPEDADTDGDLDQDLDVYAFQAMAGTYLNIKTLNLGAGSTSFVIQGPEGYVRLAPSASDSPSRQVLLPYTGNYAIILGPSQQLSDLSIGPAGGDDKDYLLVVENLGPFDLTQATTLDSAAGQTAQGNFTNLADNAYKVNSAANQLVQVSLPEIDPDAVASLLLFDDNGNIVGETGINIGNGAANVPGMDNATTVVVDHVRLSGPRDQYTVRATAPTPEAFAGPLLGDQTVEGPAAVTLQAGQSVYYDLDVQLKDSMDVALNQGVVVLVNNLPDGVVARAIGPDNKVVEGFGGLAGFYARIGGVYKIEVTNTAELAPAEIPQITAQSYIPTDFGSIAKADMSKKLMMPDVPVGDFKFFLFENTEEMAIDFTATQTTTPEAGLVIATIGPDLEVLGANGAFTPTVEFDGNVYAQPGKQIGLLFSDPGDFFNPGSDATGVELELTVADLPPTEVEPNSTTATATDLAPDTTIAATITGGPKQDVDVYKLGTMVPRPELLQVAVTGSGLTVELRDDMGNLYDANNGNVGAIVQPNSTYYAYVYKSAGFTNVDYTISMTSEEPADATAEAEPNDTEMEATTILPQLMPTFSFTAVGTLVGTGDTDWFELTIPTDGYAKFDLSGVAGLTPNHGLIEIEIYDVDMAGMKTLTMAKAGDLVAVSAGKKLIKVSGGIASGFGNSYQLQGSLVNAEDLGVQIVDTPVDKSGTFGADGEKLFGFTIAQDVPMTQIFAFASTTSSLEILDANFQPIFTSGNGGNASAGSGHLANLTAGQYFARITGADGDDWQVTAGIYQLTEEAEAADPMNANNDTQATAQDLGTLDAMGGWTYIFGDVSDLDPADNFSVTVPDLNMGMDVTLIVEQFQFGDTLYDVDLAIDDSLGLEVGDDSDGWSAPQAHSVLVAPGTYNIESVLYLTSGGNSGRYLIRAKVQP